MSNNTEIFHSMEPMDALSLFSETDETYRIKWSCGRAEAAQRQRRAGEGEVVDGGYVREVPHEFFADLADADPNAEILNET